MMPAVYLMPFKYLSMWMFSSGACRLAPGLAKPVSTHGIHTCRRMAERAAGAMVAALNVGWWGALLVAVAALTTNCVNIYMSALAFKSLRPAASGATAVWVVGGIGAALGLLSAGLLERFASFTLVLAGGLVPIGGILLAHYIVLRRPVHVPDLYDRAGPYAAHRGWSIAGVSAWIAGAAVFYAAGSIGATLPSLLASMVVYALVTHRLRPSRDDERAARR